MASDEPLAGPRFEIALGDAAYPPLLAQISDPPKRIYGIGNPGSIVPGVAVIGARKATPYGLSAAELFASRAAIRGVPIISGGARGCDQAAHKAALDVGTNTVVVFGCAADVVYPRSGRKLFNRVIAQGGAVISEQPWGMHPLPGMFPRRNRIIAGLSLLLLIAEAGLPSGTFSTADAALAAGREVAAVPGAITSQYSRGSNRLICQGATPVVDIDTFDAALDVAFERMPLSLLQVSGTQERPDLLAGNDPVLQALSADAYSAEELTQYFGFSRSELVRRISQYEIQGVVERRQDGRYQVCARRSVKIIGAEPASS